MVILISYLILLIVRVGVQGQCDQDGMKKCVEPIRLLLGDFISQSFSDMQLDDACSNITSAKSCFDEIKYNCTLLDTFESVDFNAANYICGDGKNDVKAYRDCFNLSYLENVISCEETFASDFLFVNIGSICKYTDIKNWCQVNASKVCNAQEFLTNFIKNYKYNDVYLLGCDSDFMNWQTKAYSKCGLFDILDCGPTFETRDFIDIFLVSNDKFEETCRNVQDLVDCKIGLENCLKIPFFKSAFRMYDAYHYLCVSDRTGYSKLATCFLNNNVSFLNYKEIAFANCNSLNAFIKYASNFTNNLCGNSITMNNFFNSLLSAILDISNSNCKLDSIQELNVTFSTDRIFTATNSIQELNVTFSTDHISTTNSIQELNVTFSTDHISTATNTNLNATSFPSKKIISVGQTLGLIVGIPVALIVLTATIFIVQKCLKKRNNK